MHQAGYIRIVATYYRLITTSHTLHFSLLFPDLPSSLSPLFRVTASAESLTRPTLTFAAPPSEVTTIEGILSRTADDLAADQPVRRALDADAADKIDQFIGRVKDVIELRTPATVVSWGGGG